MPNELGRLHLDEASDELLSDQEAKHAAMARLLIAADFCGAALLDDLLADAQTYSPALLREWLSSIAACRQGRTR